MKQEFDRFKASTDQRLRQIERNPPPTGSFFPNQTAIDYVLDDPKFDRMDIEKAVSAVSIALADVYFGEAVLSSSSLTGKSGARLDYRVINKIEEDIKRKFSPRIPKEKMCAAIEICQSSIATKCKTLKQKGKKAKAIKSLLL